MPDSSDEIAARSGTLKKWIALCVVGFIGLIAAFYYGIDPKLFHQWAQDQNGLLVFALLSILPLVGFPVSILYLLAGAKYGSSLGFTVVTLSIVLNLVGTWWISKGFLGKFIESLFRRKKHRLPQIPEGTHVSVSLLTALIPGVPYTAKNYLLVLGGVPFRVYFWVCLPTHALHASLAIFFGDFTKNLNTPRIIFLIAYALVLTFLCRHVVHRLKARKTG